jgi:O-antigen/teichoic acid export membrane protein
MNRSALNKGIARLYKLRHLLSSLALLGLALVAEPLILTTVGERWLETVPMLQLLCFSGMLYHLHAINLNILKVVGRTDLFLKLEIIKKVNTVMVIAISLPFGIWGLLIGQVVNSYLSLFINMYYTTKFLDYSILDQLKDVIPIVLFSVPMILIVLWLQSVFIASAPIELAVLVMTGVVVYVLTNLLVKPQALRHVLMLLQPRIPALGRIQL